MKLLYASLVVLLFAGSACAEYLRLEDEPDYCKAFDIERWCNEEGVAFLESLPPEVLSNFRYINDYAFADDVRYSGQLKIRGISVFADISTTASVEAVYEIQNTGSDSVTTEIAALETPVATKPYVDGQLIDVDPLLDGLDVTFAPGETRQVKLVYDEPLYGEIYGYNINLLFDNKTTDNHITPEGSFVFRLPRSVSIEQCVPSGYTTKTENGRLTVSWQKTDLIPWTNPFNDLICKWNSTGAGAADSGQETAAGGDNSWAIWLIIGIFAGGTVVWLYRTGRLDEILNR